MVYELYKGGILGRKYIDMAIRKIVIGGNQTRTYIFFVDGTNATIKGSKDMSECYSKFIGYLKPKDAEEMLFTESL